MDIAHSRESGYRTLEGSWVVPNRSLAVSTRRVGRTGEMQNPQINPAESVSFRGVMNGQIVLEDGRPLASYQSRIAAGG